MRASIDDWKGYQRLIAAQPNTQREYQKQTVISIAKRAETVVAHEGWQVFLDHLGAMKDSAESRRTGLVKKMTEDPDTLGEELAKLKVQCVRLDGELKALAAVVDLIPNLIQAGKDIEIPRPPTGIVRSRKEPTS